MESPWLSGNLFLCVRDKIPGHRCWDHILLLYLNMIETLKRGQLKIYSDNFLSHFLYSYDY